MFLSVSFPAQPQQTFIKSVAQIKLFLYAHISGRGTNVKLQLRCAENGNLFHFKNSLSFPADGSWEDGEP